MVKKFIPVLILATCACLFLSVNVQAQNAQTWINVTGVQNTSGVLSKMVADGWNKAGARAKNTLMSNTDGWLEFTIDQNATTANYMVGFSAINNLYIQTAIDFGVEVNSQSGLKLVAHESNATGVDLGSIVVGDVIRVGRVGSLVKYYKNGTEIRSVAGNASAYYITKVLINTGKTAAITSSYAVLNETGEIPDALEQAALKDMYDSLGGSAWTNSPYWPKTGTLPISQTSGYGVWIQNGDITRIMLQNCNVVGKIPSTIGSLAKLQYIYFITNKLSGSLPRSIGNLAELQYLYLDQNQFTGSIPSSFGELASLRLFHLGSQCTGAIPIELNNLANLTDLTISGKFTGLITDLSNLKNVTTLTIASTSFTPGAVPTWPANLPKLSRLLLNNCNLAGAIPEVLSTIQTLQTLDLSNNQLTGSIPSSLGKLSNLQWLYFYNNQLTGSIPASLGKLSNMLSLQLYGNQLSGAIPDSLGYATKLQLLSLYSNKLTGSIPSTVGNLTQLTTLSLYGNLLSGSIPASLGNMTSLQNLYLYSNQLTGEIPSSIGNLTQLTTLNLNGNQLSGSIPSSLGNLVNLKSLYLSINQLTGSIPISLGNLVKLNYLYLSQNQLTGSIPDSFGNFTLLQQLILNDNKLSGKLPSTLSNLGSVNLIQIQNNQLSGDFPDIFSGLKNLTVFHLHHNQFTGALPTSISSSTLLTFISGGVNKFTSLPSGILTLPVLGSVDFSSNELVSIPNFSTQVNKANLILHLENNQLDFSQLEPLINKGIKLLANYPQKDIIDISFVSLVTGSTLTVAARNPGQYSTIYWEKLSGTTWTSVNSLDADATLKTFVRSSAAITDVGTYRWRMTNTLVGGSIKSGSIAIETGNVADAIEFAALKDLYDSLGGTTWTNKTNWPTSWTTTATATQMDTWNGVDVVNGDISSIVLQSNNLTGKIPMSISALKSVKTLNFQTNSITGKIPTTVMTITGLTTLNLSGNQLAGTIPSSIGTLVNLKNLMLQSNQLEGTVPASLKNLMSLDQVALSNNKLSGSIPGLFGKMSGLDSLWLNNNQFTGTIPDSIQYASSLALLSADNNQLTGSIPASLGSLPLMKTLTLSHNNFEGTIPDQLQNLNNIKTLDLSYSLLTGAIPTWLVSKTALRRITLNDNKFTSFPDLSARTDKALLIINIQNNQIPVADIERYFTTQATQPFNTFIYAPQASTVAVQASLKVEVTESLTIEAPSGGTHGVYTWEKLQSNTWVNVNSQNQSSAPNIFLITHVKVSDAGKYRSTVTNSWVPGLNYQTTTEAGVHDPVKDAMDMWAFQYKYDARSRMIAKKVPGADWVYMVYDLRDRLVMTQDGEQRKLNKWTYTKYDVLNRPIITGLYTHDDVLDQQAMTDLISTTNFSESYNGDAVNHGYTNTVFSATDFLGVFDVLTVTYYDNYDFKDNTTIRVLNDARYNYKSDEYDVQYKYDASGTSFPRVIGSVTGTKTKNLGDNTYLWDVSYYDDKYRVVQTIADNVRGGIDRSTSVYDFVGRVLNTKTVHNISATPQTIARTLEYDHAGRLKWVKHSVNGADDVVLVKNEYNELGQLIDKKLHSTTTDATDARQSVDYRYNIRGWLTSVNDVGTPEASDLFSMNLNYNAPTLLGGAAQYNGNISEILWKGPDNKSNSYGYSYDPLNRLIEARYYNASDPLRNGRFNEKIWDEANNKSGYDLNGNIKSLTRSGKTGLDALGITTYGQMDNLTYNYTGNQLLKVSEAAIKTQGFIDGANTDDDYGYDANGNMYHDKNKSITGDATATGNSVISYNHLNLPEKVVKSTGEYVKYYYDATGRKLRQEVYDATNTLKKQSDYIGEFFYENDTLKFINHEEGRVVMTGTTPEYQYHLKDHLGNVRVTFTSKEAEQEENTATLEAASLSKEQDIFFNIDKARRINSAIFDHTYNNQAPPAEGVFAVRLSGTTTDGQTKEKIGLIRSLSVMPGDKITVEVYAKYVDLSNSSLNSSVRSLVTSIASGTASAGTVIDGNHYGTSDASAFPYGGDLADEKALDTRGGPKAYLNYLVFDKDFNFISSKSDYKKVTTDAAEDGSTITVLNPDGKSHQQLTASIDITEAGYVYIYLSNEEETPVEVYFDDFKVTQVKSPVIATNDYYPFGLAFNSYSREGSVKQDYLYNGKELQDELGLNWEDYGARMYMSDIGRWGVVDPLADKMRRHSPYNYCFDNPLRFIDPDGMGPNDHYYGIVNNELKYIGSDGQGDDIRLVAEGREEEASQLLDKVTETSVLNIHGGNAGSDEVNALRDESMSTVVTFDEGNVQQEVQAANDRSVNNGLENSALITFDPATATVGAESGAQGTNNKVTNTVNTYGGSSGEWTQDGSKLVIGIAHGHPLQTDGSTNLPGYSKDDSKTAGNSSGATYAIDSYSAGAGGGATIHQANPGGKSGTNPVGTTQATNEIGKRSFFHTAKPYKP